MAITRKKDQDTAPAESVALATPVQDQGANPAAEIDPGPISFSDAQEVITSRGAGGASEKTSVFDDVIKASYETEKTKEFTVPTASAKAQSTALRSAANRLNVGLRVRQRENSNGTTTIQFLAKDKQVRGPRAKNGENAAQTADTDAGTATPSGDA